ncbi:MAG: hypothetical protein COV76_02350 [Candidatus Omnitrophica bacterium CG11_big_fil_rev_8_21_14_0_20_64_10]|nr:MAG: hypothetical protein COV76_02350 [Candidatus Omnitrophica bacterium CG11_big_fil_rev_8_21_14_0_20_64_10]
MSLANKISLFRILLVPGFVACLLYYRPGESEVFRYAAVGLFLLGTITDAVDGYIARAANQASRLGAILDPAADKLFLVTAFLSLSLITTLPPEVRLEPWVPLLVFTRDILIVSGWLLVVLVTGDIRAYPSKLGKATTLFQMLTIVTVLLGFSYSRIVLWIAMGLTVLSGIGYLRLGNQLLNFKKSD